MTWRVLTERTALLSARRSHFFWRGAINRAALFLQKGPTHKKKRSVIIVGFIGLYRTKRAAKRSIATGPFVALFFFSFI